MRREVHRLPYVAGLLLILLPGGNATAQHPIGPFDAGRIVSQSSSGLPALWLQGTDASSSSYLDRHWRSYWNIDAKNPPDPHGAAGPLGIFHINNRGVTYARKNGNVYYSTITLADFFTLGAPVPNDILDPRGLYDPATGRFFVTALEVPSLHTDVRAFLHLAVSKTSHPASMANADWHRYRFEVTDYIGPDRYGMDYPGLAIDGAAVYVTGNMFHLPIDGTHFFRNCKVVVIDKLQAAAGTLGWRSVSTPATFNLGDAFTLQPATAIGPGSTTAYFAEMPYDGPYDRLRLWALPDPLGSGTLQQTLVTIPPTGGIAGYAPQCSVSYGVRTWSPTAQGNVFVRDGDLWLCHTGVLAAKSVVRWYRVGIGGWPAGTPSLLESGVIDGGVNVWTYQPAIGGNSLGDVAIVYAQSDASTCPTMMGTARSAQTGTFSAPVVIHTSINESVKAPVESYGRWGDYASVTEDPVDHSLWVTHEWIHDPGSGSWATEWGNFRFPIPFSGWPAAGRPVRDAQSDIRDAIAVPDGSNGLLVAWSESRMEQWQVFVRRILADGSEAPGWPDGGTWVTASPVSYAPAERIVPTLVADGLGGAYVGFAQNGQSRIQHIAATGAVTPGWPADGVALGSGDAPPRMVLSLDHSVIATWDVGGAIAVQRIGSDGTAQWGAGVGLGEGFTPAIASDGVGGGIVAWEPASAQRIDPSGVTLWGSGIALDPSGSQPRPAPNGLGGATVSWLREQPDGTTDIFALGFDGSGAILPGWPAEGAPVCTANGNQVDQQIVPGNALGSSIVVWKDRRNFATKKHDIYAVALTGSGDVAPGWVVNGTPVCTAAGEQQLPSIAVDGRGGALITWQDRRGSPACNSGPCGDDLYWMRLNASGNPGAGFPVDGALLNGAAGIQAMPTLVRADDGVAITAYVDGRGAPDCVPWCGTAVYASRAAYDVTTDVPRGVSIVTSRLDAPVPNPADQRVAVSWVLAGEHLGKAYEVGVYDVAGRRIRRLAGGTALADAGRRDWNRLDDDGRRVAAGIYFIRLTVGVEQQRRTLVLR